MNARGDKKMAVVIGESIQDDHRMGPSPGHQIAAIVLAGQTSTKEAGRLGT
jgi:hypothetical protein